MSINHGQQRLFRKHGIERLELSVVQAHDWVEFYEEFGPPETAEAWRRTHQHRKNLWTNACDEPTTP